MRRAPSFPIVLSLLGCSSGATQVPRSVSASPTGNDAAPPRVAVEAPRPDCASDHVWDDAAGACRLFPGGGYGWAGCSLAKVPPNGEACITGTRWRECDCQCDPVGAVWNKTTTRCEEASRRSPHG